MIQTFYKKLTSVRVLIILCQFFSLHAGATVKSNAELNVLFVVDGLRPDVISPDNTPNIYSLVQKGVVFENSHAVFPTVTRVNSAAIATGAYPIVNGIVSNSMYVADVHLTRSFSTGEYKNLLKLDESSDGRLIHCKSWAQRLVEIGKIPAAVSSGSTGSAFLLNHRAPQGVGILVNGYFRPGEILAYPESANSAILGSIGAAPSLEGAPNYNAKVDWITRVLNDYVLAKIKPDVIYCWLTEPDHTQHGAGIGGPRTLETVRNSDRAIGSLIEKLKQNGLFEKSNIFIASDHGFSTY